MSKLALGVLVFCCVCAGAGSLAWHPAGLTTAPDARSVLIGAATKTLDVGSTEVRISLDTLAVDSSTGRPDRQLAQQTQEAVTFAQPDRVAISDNLVAGGIVGTRSWVYLGNTVWSEDNGSPWVSDTNSAGGPPLGARAAAQFLSPAAALQSDAESVVTEGQGGIVALVASRQGLGLLTDVAPHLMAVGGSSLFALPAPGAGITVSVTVTHGRISSLRYQWTTVTQQGGQLAGEQLRFVFTENFFRYGQAAPVLSPVSG